MRFKRCRALGIFVVLLLVISVGGQSWAHHTLMHSGRVGALVLAIAIDSSQPETLYLGAFGGGVFKSTDGGKLWIGANKGLKNLEVRTVVIDPANQSILYAGTDEGLFKSIDAGAHWAMLAHGLGNASIRSLVIDTSMPGTLYAGTHQGVFKSIDGGEHWSAGNVGLRNLDVRALLLNPAAPQTVYAGTFGGV